MLFYGLNTSFCGSTDVILWLRGRKFVGQNEFIQWIKRSTHVVFWVTGRLLMGKTLSFILQNVRHFWVKETPFCWYKDIISWL